MAFTFRLFTALPDVIKGYLDVSSSILRVLSIFKNRKLHTVIVSAEKEMNSHSNLEYQY